MAGVKEDDSGASMLPASAIFEICSFSAFSDMEYNFFEWEITQLDCFWHKTESCFKGIAHNKPIKAINISIFS